jgi:probable nitrogen fixation protein
LPEHSATQAGPISGKVYPFVNCVLSILDSYDKFGLWAQKPKEARLQKYFLLDSDAFKGADTLCGADSAPIRRQAAIFFQAVAMALEIRTGARIGSIVEMDDEGLGRAVVYSGRLVLSVHGWRQGQFGFTSMDKAIEEGERFIAAGLDWLERYPDIAQL